MALIVCPDCGHEVSPQAKSCPNCGHRFINYEKRRKVKKSVLIILAIAAIIGLIVIIVLAAEDAEQRRLIDEYENSPEHKEYEKQAKAVDAVKNAVKNRCKSPSTAKVTVSSTKEVSSGTYKGWYYLTGYVDAQNGFGATVRNSFTAYSNGYSVKDLEFK